MVYKRVPIVGIGRVLVVIEGAERENIRYTIVVVSLRVSGL